MRTAILVVLGYGLLLNSVFMLLAPQIWFALTPGVEATGPFNQHFVRDVGSVYFMIGASLLWMMRDVRAWPAALAGAVFLALHALVHVRDAIEFGIVLEVFAFDLVAVFLPVALVLWLALGARVTTNNSR